MKLSKPSRFLNGNLLIAIITSPYTYEGVIAYMLLGSALPFFGKHRDEIIKKIIHNKFHFRARRWKNVSDEAKAFIQDLLVLDPERRCDAESALSSIWLEQQGSAPTSTMRSPRREEEDMAKTSLLKYAKYPKLKKMVSHSSPVIKFLNQKLELNCPLIACIRNNSRRSWWLLTSQARKRLVSCVKFLKNMILGMMDPYGSKNFQKL